MALLKNHANFLRKHLHRSPFFSLIVGSGLQFLLKIRIHFRHFAKDSIAGVCLWTLKHISQQLLHRTTSNYCFWWNWENIRLTRTASLKQAEKTNERFTQKTYKDDFLQFVFLVTINLKQLLQKMKINFLFTTRWLLRKKILELVNKNFVPLMTIWFTHQILPRFV